MLKSVRVTFVAVEKKTINITCSECVYVALGYPACNAHALYFIVICGMSGCTIFFFTLSHEQYRFSKKKTHLLNINCVLNFSTNFV